MNLYRIATSTLVLAAMAAWAPSVAQAQTADVSGAWTLSVDVQGQVTAPTVTFEQDGETLTGSYSSETLGDADLTGTVSGNDVAFSFQAALQGQAVPVNYNLTLNDDGTLSGTIDLAGMASGNVTGTRDDM